MKHKTSELEGALLDAAVAMAEGRFGADIRLWGDRPFIEGGGGMPGSNITLWAPSTDWTQGGPIIERERIAIAPPETDRPGMNWEWRARCYGTIDSSGEFFASGEHPRSALIAAMRAFVESKFGEEVELP